MSNQVIDGLEYEMEASDLHLLQLACEAWDRCAEARKVIDEKGMVYLDRFDFKKLIVWRGTRRVEHVSRHADTVVLLPIREGRREQKTALGLLGTHREESNGINEEGNLNSTQRRCV